MVKYPREAVREIAAALSTDSRLLIIDRLRQGTATSTELAAAAGIGLPAVHKQLTILQQAGLVVSAKDGRVVSHRLRVEGLDVLADWLRTRQSFWANSFHELDRALQTDDSPGDSHGGGAAAHEGKEQA
jgi:DNA-binding transcriptional ArsR family regulator